MDEVARTRPRRIITVNIHPRREPAALSMPATRVRARFSGAQMEEFTAALRRLSIASIWKRMRARWKLDPLIVTAAGQIVALDARSTSTAMRCIASGSSRAARLEQEDPMEPKRASTTSNYVSLDGDIACMVNGAGSRWRR